MDAGPMATSPNPKIIQSATRKKEGITVVKCIEESDVSMMNNHHLIVLRKWIDRELNRRSSGATSNKGE